MDGGPVRGTTLHIVLSPTGLPRNLVLPFQCLAYSPTLKMEVAGSSKSW
jgi:hypothetical protein